MVTILDPGGTPTPTYNRSGTTLANITGGTVSGSSPVGNDGTTIVRYSEYTIAVATVSSTTGVVTLPDDAEIGDVVEVHSEGPSTNNATVFPPIGETIRGFDTSTGTNSGAGMSTNPLGSAIVRKTSASVWHAVRGA